MNLSSTSENIFYGPIQEVPILQTCQAAFRLNIYYALIILRRSNFYRKFYIYFLVHFVTFDFRLFLTTTLQGVIAFERSLDGGQLHVNGQLRTN
jgi:hypothetical protein